MLEPLKKTKILIMLKKKMKKLMEKTFGKGLWWEKDSNIADLSMVKKLTFLIVNYLVCNFIIIKNTKFYS